MPHLTLITLLILALLAGLFLCYALLPEALFHWLHIGTFYKGLDAVHGTVRAVSLTFDDGPDERYTPAVLDCLRNYNVRATFFLVAENALQQPALVQRMIREGHEIASHSCTHRHAWLQNPFTVFQDVRESKRILENLTGQPVRFYRPPWGAFSLVSRLAIRAAGLKPVLWSGRAMDWMEKQTGTAVRNNMINSACSGAIILCHDAGGAEAAPVRTIEALPEAIETIQALQYSFQTVGDLHNQKLHETRPASKASLYKTYPLPRRSLIFVWRLVEWGFTRLYKIESLDEIFRFNRTVWSFGPRQYTSAPSPTSAPSHASPPTSTPAAANHAAHLLPKQALLHDGMPALDLHFQNTTLAMLSQADNPKSLIGGLRQTRRGLQRLAALLQYHPAYHDIQAITGVTLIHRGIETLGFHVEDLPSHRERRRLERYMRFLMALYHPDGVRRLRQGRQSLHVKHVWMSRQELIDRYGKAAAT
ncbi:polysaccharide deacetylase family protein [Alicyclobacillus sp. SO9]|uniref:polysaccharide deacetylase family protein n=1 Tax=Alicyclobacillus sp. SO9 TaxID=2665646 RepID=UPI0018E86B6C|nr:polysaccharide deacetylase family protein [Alicyclobacillus sp. SO9]QQE78784.1 polysaccharide deacetylase family protein [Alicyclobacillus sp. SO9]